MGVAVALAASGRACSGVASPRPIPRSPHWMARVNEPLTERELAARRRSAQRRSPFGESSWIESTAQRLGLSSTLNPRSRPQVRFEDELKHHDS